MDDGLEGEAAVDLPADAVETGGSGLVALDLPLLARLAAEPGFAVRSPVFVTALRSLRGAHARHGLVLVRVRVPDRGDVIACHHERAVRCACRLGTRGKGDRTGGNGAEECQRKRLAGYKRGIRGLNPRLWAILVG